MAIRYKRIQTNFTAGEVSPRLLARTDLDDAYDQALKTLENAYSLPHGGAKRRPGSVFVGEVRDSTKNVRLIPFVYSQSISYVLVLNNGYMQFVRDGSFIQSGSPLSDYEIAIPWGNTELNDITYTQFGSSMFLCHEGYAPRQLVRNSETSWTLSEISFTHNALADAWFKNAYVEFKIYTTGDGFDVDDKFEFTTDGSGNVSAGPTFTGSGTGGMAAITVDADLDNGVTWTAKCVYSDTTRQEFDVYNDQGGGSPVAYPSMPIRPPAEWAPSDYPHSVCFFEQRLFFAGSPSYPQTVWGTQIGDYLDLTLGPNDDDGVKALIASGRFDKILHLEAARALLPLSYGGEFTFTGGQNSGITPGAKIVRAHTYHGTKNVRPIRIADEVLFVQRDGLKVRAISYDVTRDANVAPDITLLAEHITGTGDGIVDMTYQQAPDGILWAVRDDGVLLSCTHLVKQKVTAWSRHITDGLYKAVCAIPENDRDVVYQCVERTISDGGSPPSDVTKRYIEYMDSTMYVDSGLTGSSSPVTDSWSGLDHLEGQTVDIVADGKVHPQETVTSGAITLDYDAAAIQSGLHFEVDMEMLHPEVLSREGTSQGSQLRIYEAVFRLQDTIGLTVNGKDVPVMTTQETMDAAPSPFTGDKQVPTVGWTSPNNIRIQHTLPAPFTLLGVVQKLTIGD